MAVPDRFFDKSAWKPKPAPSSDFFNKLLVLDAVSAPNLSVGAQYYTEVTERRDAETNIYAS